MPRFFIEVAYKGTRYSGFQIQQNANTVQAEIEKAYHTLHRRPVKLTGSSRTDAGVHALQNYFHFDDDVAPHPQAVYKLNAILPDDVVVKNMIPVGEDAHCRFDAVSRCYEYSIYRYKNPFLVERAYYYPFTIDAALMDEAAAIVKEQTNFYTFSKAHTQVANHQCRIINSAWVFEKDTLAYTIEGNRFLRGMVRMLTATMLKVGRGQITIAAFKNYFESNERCAYAAPAHGLYLKSVCYPADYFN